MIQIDRVSKTFQSDDGQPVEALREVSLDIEKNEFVTILGPSGCGKTTLLKTIAGLVKFDAGEIRVADKVVSGPGPDRAMVFQHFALMPWATVLENVGFGLEMRKVPKSEREDRARELIAKVGLRGFESKRPGQLSGGMQQRVGLARALAVEPQVLLMDEPFGAVDEQTRRLLQEELLSIWERDRLTVVFITHSMEEAVLLGDRVVLMSARPGQIAEIVPVPLARPRSTEMTDSTAAKDYAQITGYLWRRLREMHEEHRMTEAISSSPESVE